MDATTILLQAIPVAQLHTAAENTRTTAAGDEAHAELKASILAHGLLKNLVVQKTADDGFAVVAGARRLAALRDLISEGRLPEDMTVACNIYDGDNPAEVSLAENVTQVAMHPADQIVAWSALASQGQTAEQIATRFGTTEAIVAKRVRLGQVEPSLIDAYRLQKFSLEVLHAFAGTADHNVQLEVYDRIKSHPYGIHAHEVSRLIHDGKVAGHSPVARFVGIDAYEAAGGRTELDLFARQDDRATWFEDGDLLNRLAMEKLQAEADRIAGDWKWVEARMEVDWEVTSRLGRVHASPGELTDDERSEYEKLTARRDELSELDPTEIEQDELDKLQTELAAAEDRIYELDELIEERGTWSDEARAMAGCLVTFNARGELDVQRGFVRPEDMPEQEGRTDQTGGNDFSPATVSSDAGKKPAADGSGYSKGVAEDLRLIRGSLIKAHLAKDFPAAFDLLLYQLARETMERGHAWERALDISPTETSDHPMGMVHTKERNAWAERSPGIALLIDVGLDGTWLNQKTPAKQFAALCAMPTKAKQRLFAACVARSLHHQLATDDKPKAEIEATVDRLKIAFADWVDLKASWFWSRVPKAKMLEIGRKVLGDQWADDRAALKKGPLAEAMETAFAKTPADDEHGLTAAKRSAARAWLPDGFGGAKKPARRRAGKSA